MSIVKKITIISLTLAIALACLVVPSSAINIVSRDQMLAMREQYQILTPLVIRMYHYENENERWGQQINGSPLYPDSGIQTASYQQTETHTSNQPPQDYTGITEAEWHSVKTVNIRTTWTKYTGSNVNLSQVVQRYWFGNASTNYFSDLQLAFAPFYVSADVSPATWQFQVHDHDSYIDLSISYFNTDGEIKTINGSLRKHEIDPEYNTISMRDIVDYLLELGTDEYLPHINEDGFLAITNLTLASAEVPRSDWQITANTNAWEEIKCTSLAGTYVDATTDYTDFNILTWLGTALDGFLNTTIFTLGNTPVTLATLVTIPLALMILVAFLKKFAGG